MRSKLERSLPLPVADIRRALQAFDDAVSSSLEDLEAEATRAG
jgi:hypothetical protein